MMTIIIVLISLAGIVLGADWLVDGSVAIAKRYRVSDFVIGAAIIGIGTSMPELTVSFAGAIHGNSDVAIGNIVGSNIFNILGILGVTALLFPIPIEKANMKFEIPLCIAVSVLITLLSFNFFCGSDTPVITRTDGLILLAVFAFYMWYSLRKGKNIPMETVAETEEKTMKLWKALCLIIIGLAILVSSCDLFVDKAMIIARESGMSEAVIAITLIGCGTSLPELAASLVAAYKKNTQLALGNIIGSNIFNIAMILGVSAQVTDLSSENITLADYLVMILAAVLPVIWGIRGRISRLGGAIMLIIFIGYCIYLIN